MWTRYIHVISQKGYNCHKVFVSGLEIVRSHNTQFLCVWGASWLFIFFCTHSTFVNMKPSFFLPYFYFVFQHIPVEWPYSSYLWRWCVQMWWQRCFLTHNVECYKIRQCIPESVKKKLFTFLQTVVNGLDIQFLWL